MKDYLVQMTCPACQHEDQAFDSDLRGTRLVCSECGTHMERDDGDDDDEEVCAALSVLCKQTGTQPHEWDEIEGPATDGGIARYYIHVDGREAYVSDDRGQITVTVTP